MASQEFDSMDILKIESACATGPQLEQAQNPWPHLNDYFLLKSGVGDKLIFQCQVCLPKTVLVKGHMTSLNNLKQHIKRTHPVKFMQFSSCSLRKRSRQVLFVEKASSGFLLVRAAAAALR